MFGDLGSVIMYMICFICGINHGTLKYITPRRQIEWVCAGCDNKEIEVNNEDS